MQAALDEDRVRSLMGETAWLRRLARSLVRDPAAADDLVQDAWLIAAAKAPADRPLRPWLARVMLNLVRMRRRSEQRRVAREAHASEGGATPDELYERVEAQRLLADAVLALAAPYRNVVLLHYVEGLTSVEIGRRLGIADATARWRLRTALAELRSRLDERTGGKRAAWLAPVGALANTSSKPFWAAAGGLTMKKLIVAVVVIVLLGILWFAVRDRGQPGATNAPVATHQVRAQHGAAARAWQVPAWMVQPGLAPRRIAGHVLADGKPVAGARVELAVIGLPGDRRLAVTTDGTGAFDLGRHATTSYLLGATAAGRAARSLRLDLADPTTDHERVVIELAGCVSRLTGKVSDASGGPIAHARLIVEGTTAGETDARGHYELCIAPELEFEIEADGYATITRQARVYGRLQHDVALVIEGTIAGRVVTTDGAPVPNARVVAIGVLARPGAARRLAVSGDDGSFQLDGLASGLFRLVVDAQDLAGATEPVAVRPGQIARQDVTVTASSSLVGRVVMAGAPVAGVRVSVRAAQDIESPPAFSQRDGSFAIPTPPRGHVQLVTWPHKLVTPAWLDIGAQNAPITLEVKPTTTIRGRVTQGGAPVAEAYVTCDSLVPKSVITDHQGRFELEGLDGPRCELAAYATTKSGMSDRVPVELVPGVMNVDIDLVSSSSVAGLVVDEAGAPVPNAFVMMVGERNDNCEALTDEHGRFEVESMVGKMAYHPRVFPSPAAGAPFPPVSGTAFDAVEVPDGNTHVTGLRLAVRAARGSIRGRVVDDDGQPVADAWVEAIGRGGQGGSMLMPSADTDRDGRFEIGNLATGRFLLRLRGPDGASAALDNVATGSDVTITMPRGGRIEGTLAGFAAHPLVAAHDPFVAGGEVVRGWVEGDRFKIVGLAPGSYIVSALGGGADLAKVTVRASETTHVDLTSRGTARVDATLVMHRTGTPIAGAPCVATGSAFGVPAWWPQPFEMYTDAGGRVVLRDAPAGHVRVMCFPQHSSIAMAELDVAAGGAAVARPVSVPIIAPGVDPGFTLQPFVMPPQVRVVAGGGPAAAAGLVVGDLIVKLDGEDVTSLGAPAVLRLAKNHAPGSVLTLVVRRGAALRTIAIKVATP